MIPKKYRVAVKRILWVFVPAVLVITLGVTLLEGYLTYRLTRPPRTQLYGSPRDFQEILSKPMWFDEKWKNSDGTQTLGWLLTRQSPAPAIILSHGYGENRSELLTLGFELWKAGYHVLLYDLRGHGESPVNWSGLGTYEKDDVLSAISFLQGLKDAHGEPLVHGSIGLYGVDIGGYASLLAASQSPAVKAIAADSVYPDVAHYLNYRLKAFVGSGSTLTSLIDAPLSKKLTNISMDAYLMRRSDSAAPGAVSAIANSKRVLFIVGKDSGGLGAMTLEMYAQTRGQSQLEEVDKSRINRLYDKDSSSYDAKVLAFFAEAMPVTAPPLAGDVRASK